VSDDGAEEGLTLGSGRGRRCAADVDVEDSGGVLDVLARRPDVGNGVDDARRRRRGSSGRRKTAQGESGAHRGSSR
jgi:hypothetical protein